VEYHGKTVPEILLSGDHAKIDQWRRKEALRATLRHRPELLRQMRWQKGDGKLFLAVKEEEKQNSQADKN
jgi:tRNA (guanine37-N1)-methyltransferase